MRVCFPVLADDGTIYGHFASAPFFAILDTETGESDVIPNCDPANPFAGCDPFNALSRQVLDGIVVGGVGDESVRVMHLCGFKLYQANSASIAENMALFTGNHLPEVELLNSHLEGRCVSDGEGSTCGHDHH